MDRQPTTRIRIPRKGLATTLLTSLLTTFAAGIGTGVALRTQATTTPAITAQAPTEPPESCTPYARRRAPDGIYLDVGTATTYKDLDMLCTDMRATGLFGSIERSGNGIKGLLTYLVTPTSSDQNGSAPLAKAHDTLTARDRTPDILIRTGTKDHTLSLDPYREYQGWRAEAEHESGVDEKALRQETLGIMLKDAPPGTWRQYRAYLDGLLTIEGSRHDQRSRAGAVGIPQVMPAMAAREELLKRGVMHKDAQALQADPAYGPKMAAAMDLNLLHPPTCAGYASRIARESWDKLSRRGIHMAGAAYNAGAPRVLAHLDTHQPLPRETANYASRMRDHLRRMGH